MQKSKEDLIASLALNLLRVQLSAFETALKNNLPEVYQDYMVAYDHLYRTDDIITQINESLEEIKVLEEMLQALPPGSIRGES